LVISNEDQKDIWSTAYLIDNIFNDLMDKSMEDKNGKKINKYVYQAITKLQDFRRKSPATFFDIFKDDLSNETVKRLNNYITDCNSENKIYKKLNGLMTEVIALIYKQAESLILSNIENEDVVWVKKAINEMRQLIKNRWRLVKANGY
jgi:hypothetical protein